MTDETHVTQETDGTDEHVSATLTVPAPAARVFAVLADPAAHAAIDGTGWVQEPVDLAPLTAVGQLFRMGMYHSGHPDGTYEVVNRVHVYEPPRAVGWFTGYRRDDGELEFGGWYWRYDLERLDPSTTAVTLTYDWSAVPDSVRAYLRFPMFGPHHLTDSLTHLSTLATTTPPP
ncbi:polyketide cyclase [Streptomyces phytohabitans]|uniref:polyketide cyclase n=1 Tax=Streptomyces phytohabitans TaxID=1150371 RepID=UPI00345BD66F